MGVRERLLKPTQAEAGGSQTDLGVVSCRDLGGAGRATVHG